MKNIILLMIALFGLSSYGQIQKGKVLDSDGNPVENAYLVNTNSESHAHTNEFGLFSLDKTVLGNVIKITALGYKKSNFTIVSSDDTIILEDDIFRLNEIVIQPKLSAMNVISKIDLQTTPVNSSQEILRKVPGLFIGQHAGGGKAEQIFLRGFDIDHGTDIAISVDGMPVNMVSHAHGQGYADLHFVIPETVEKIDFGKGTYYANKGDFATAGYVAFQTKDKIEKSSIGLEIGQFNTMRTVGLFNLLGNQKTQSAYIATEYILTDGPFDSPQNFNRINLLGKYSAILSDNSKFSILVSRFSSKWDASGQIPQRLIDNGTISRFGSVDDTEGGNTSRTNFSASLSKPIDENTFLKANAFYSNYQFELYSNFTFFLEDPINGDQIKQKENRDIYGMNAELNKKTKLNDVDVLLQFGGGFRADATKDTELSHTLNRRTVLENIKLGDIDESNLFSYLNSEFNFGKLMINPAIRLDYFKFNYQDKLTTDYKTQSESKVKFSPKLNFIYSQNNNLQFFIKSGIGFHSNDARVVVQNSGKQILPTAIGTDVGTIWKPFPRLIVNSALWYLFLEQEFVYVGDAGIIEPSGKSKRMGAELGLRYQLNDWLYFDADANYTYARSIDEPKGQDYIPLAPDFTTTGGLSFQKVNGFSGGIRYRYLKNRPANEDNSIVAKGYFISDLNVNYQYKNINFGIAVENIFDTEWNETQFATESRLQNEPESVEEIHFTPGTPFFMKGKITYTF
ncbi:TonB-dependent receptor [Flavobacterium yafengii]|uniref:TonB-dependent receptor n=1 Tax=Flavobacterium yafengii TaxID=3041253 RepID=UPI0024A85025|nr:TonB-dependent receptor plug domain-containing protein [Flavobacterium yafengii]MDI5897573.1 TonB-dependent receptor plug domain-containing protein [Flavobacterium yafengii]MDI6046961.1 TonB-dependent receptor plug domain-containing protein [Flavobacterium yafengii]